MEVVVHHPSFKRLGLTPEQLRQQRWFTLFGERLLAPRLWQATPVALSGAMAAGLFTAWVPLPMHSLLAVVLALFFGLNLPLALLAVWFNNPATLPFMYLVAYETGCRLLGITPEHFHLIWSVRWFEQEAGRLLPPFLTGSLLLGLISALLGYLITLCAVRVWRYWIAR
ncbi:Uncharacterized conserved protein, DUF2062 family [Aeromonas sp. RU39B]|uniref:DUF2062 domain-containing protein n=1 Tax=Aeromonas sp. RU39B TaxID=1907416 RepID=UPI000954F2FA|nr:DUF2062 domain-containing protein [Aeromonas sp. RU39B]SIR37082.1 Uncharacterized conserved protein, DUF2062 family [Aeromonas sp. RU39B]